MNAVLFVGMFAGMSCGALLGSVLLAHYGWTAVTGMATVAALAALGVRLMK
jgi:predicted MFS family arabinose efflux permease